MWRWLDNVYRLGLKELASLAGDTVLVAFFVFSFSFMIYSEATGVESEVRNANIAMVDADQSVLSRQLRDAMLSPQFKATAVIDRASIDLEMDRGRYTFVLEIPPRFQADLLSGRQPELQLNIDATAMSQAGVGANFIEEIVRDETAKFLQTQGMAAELPVKPVVRAFFNPNLESTWFQAVMSLIENITLISIVLVGAAVIREREHGTIEHLLVMPLRASEIACAKIWASGLAVLVAAGLSLTFIIRILLQVPIEGSIPLFLLGTALYLFATTSLGILLATIANSMPQLGLLVMPVFLILTMLSGSTSPLQTMPAALQIAVQASPSVHFVKATQAVLYRSAGLDIIWPQLLILAGLGALFLAAALLRFRQMLTRQA
jgi:ABC-2 type transport system permease protein